jgi:hypothetical protein
MPHIARAEVVQLRKSWGVDPDTFATVRVDMLERPAAAGAASPARAVVVSNVSSWGREAWVALPACAAVTDLFTGEEFRVDAGQVRLPLDPYAVRLLALSP